MAANTSNTSAKENTQTACLSDVDDIPDIDIDEVADELHKTISAKPVRRENRSIFNTTLDLTESRPASRQVDDAVAAYRDYVLEEKQNWESFITHNLPKPGALQAASASYQPSQEQQAYLSQGPNLQSFIRNSGAFMNDSSKFLMAYEQMLDLQQDLKDCCEFHVHNIQRNNIAECLARI